MNDPFNDPMNPICSTPNMEPTETTTTAQRQWMVPAFLLIDAPNKEEADDIAGDIGCRLADLLRGRCGSTGGDIRFLLDEVLPTREVATSPMQEIPHSYNPDLISAVKRLAWAYQVGSESSSVDWSDVDEAHALAVRALKPKEVLPNFREVSQKNKAVEPARASPSVPMKRFFPGYPSMPANTPPIELLKTARAVAERNVYGRGTGESQDLAACILVLLDLAHAHPNSFGEFPNPTTT